MDVHYIIFGLSAVALIISVLTYLFQRTREALLIAVGTTLSVLGVFSWTWAVHLWMHLHVPKTAIMIYTHLGFILLALGLYSFAYTMYKLTGDKKMFNIITALLILAIVVKYGGLLIGNRGIAKLSHLVFGVPMVIYSLISAYMIYKEAKDIPGTIMALAYTFLSLTFTAHHILNSLSALLLDSIALLMVALAGVLTFIVLRVE